MRKENENINPEEIEEEDFAYSEEELAESEAEGLRLRKLKEDSDEPSDPEEAIEEADEIEAVDEASEEEVEIDEPAEVEEDSDEVEAAENYESEEYYEEDYEEEEEDEETIRRRERHSRRVRNQIVSYSVISVLLIGLGIGIFFLVTNTTAYVKQYLAEQKAVEEAAQEQAEEVIVEAPGAIEEAAAEDAEAAEIDEEIFEEVDYLGEAVEATISQMTIEDKVAQLFMTTPEALTGVGAATQAGDGTKAALDKYAVAGLIYSNKNLIDEEQTITLLDTTSGMSKYELFLGVSEPGGDSNVISKSSIDGIPQVDSPAVIGESGQADNAYNSGMTIASYMSTLGFNLNLSPDGSVITDENSVAKDTSYGADEAQAYDMAVKMIAGLSEGNIISCMTGFPGNGNITSSTADGVVESEITAEELEAQLLPYISGTAAGAKLVMLNNVTYVTCDTYACPSSVSPYIIRQVLRSKMGYEGVVVTGSLSDKAITADYTPTEAAVAAITAGADILYVPENFEETYAGVLEAVKAGTITEDRINESLNRIFRVKLSDDVE